jgi:activator of HSP90 ATPase
MRNVITQAVELPSKQLFQMYLDPVVHGAITGLPVTIGREAGSAFSAFDGKLSGTMLVVIEPRLIVQSWRSVKFKPEDPDSTLILSFSETPTAGRIDLIHLDVPVQDLAGVTDGWHKFYWEPWRRYLNG